MRTHRQYDLADLHGRIADNQRTIGKACLALDIAHTVIGGQQIDIFFLAQRRDKIVLRRRQYGPVIHLDSAPKAGKARGGKPTMHRFGGADQRLGRNAANIDTGAANRAVTDERHFRAQIGSGDRGGVPGRTRADDGHVKSFLPGAVATVVHCLSLS